MINFIFLPSHKQAASDTALGLKKCRRFDPRKMLSKLPSTLIANALEIGQKTFQSTSLAKIWGYTQFRPGESEFDLIF